MECHNEIQNSQSYLQMQNQILQLQQQTNQLQQMVENREGGYYHVVRECRKSLLLLQQQLLSIQQTLTEFSNQLIKNEKFH